VARAALACRCSVVAGWPCERSPDTARAPAYWAHAPPPPPSRADLPSELYEVMAVMCRAGRPLPALALQPDDAAGGCTVLGAWVRRRLDALAALQQPGGRLGACCRAPLAGGRRPAVVLRCRRRGVLLQGQAGKRAARRMRAGGTPCPTRAGVGA
jgi:hypothetical protein